MAWGTRPRAIAIVATLALAATVVTQISQRTTPRALAASALPTGTSDSAPQLAGELIGLRTETSQTFRTRDGDYATFIYPAPVNYRASDGSLEPIDPTLIASDAGY